jgi:signal transduction histidine kinase
MNISGWIKVKWKTTLSKKIVILFSFLTLGIILIIIAHFYFSTLSNIKSNARDRIRTFSFVVKETFGREVDFIFRELYLLQKSIKYSLSSNSSVQGEVFSEYAVENFLRGYPYKYNELIINYNNSEKFFSFSPIKVFSGEIRIKKEVKTELGVQSVVNSKHIFFSESDEIIARYFILNNYFWMKLNSRQPDGIKIFGSVGIDFFLEKISEKFNPFLKYDISFIDSSGFVNSTSKPVLLYKNLGDTLKAKGISLNSLINEPVYYSDENKFISGIMIDELKVVILLEEDISAQINELNSVIIKLILFSVLLSAIVLVAILFFTKKLSGAINKITSVADSVASGDYSKKIDFKSNDEVGLLIETFNSMIDKVKESYENLNVLNAELEGKINELIKTKNELSAKERLAVIGETVSKISHEIQNKISGISIWVQNLEMQVPQDNKLKFYTGEIRSALKSFQETLINFKKFYRQPTINKSTVVLQEIVDKILFDLSKELEVKQIALVKAMPDHKIILHVDKDLIEEALMNILINSIHYSPQRGRIGISVGEFDKKIRIAIRNDGPGIKEENAEKIFQPFFTTRTSGSGLGLSITQNIIKAHSGEITFYNPEDGGVVFEIILPIEELKTLVEDKIENIIS